MGFPALLSCGSKDEDTSLKIEMKPDTSFILPGKHDSTCYDTDINGPRLSYPRMVITWDGDANFFPAIIKIKFKSADLTSEYECTFDEEIPAFFNDANNTRVAVNYFVKGVYTLRTECAIECGNIPVENENKVFKANGEVKMVGYSIDTDNNQKPYSARATIFLENLN